MNTEILAEAFDEFSRAAAKIAAALRAEVSRSVNEAARAPRASKAAPPASPPPRRESKPTPLPTDYEERVEVSKTEYKILVALAQVGRSLSSAQLGLFTGLAHKGGAFAKALTDLRADGMIVGGAKGMTITDAGVAQLGDFKPLPVGHALFEFWCNKLGTTAEKILRALKKSKLATGAELGAATELSHTGGAFAAALTSLRRMDLIKGGSVGMTLHPDFARAIEPTITVFDKSSGTSHRVDLKGLTRWG